MKNILYLFLVSTLSFMAVDYNTEIQPIFNDNCGNCHLGSSSGGLNLSDYNNLMSSDVVIPGDHQNSELYDRITRLDSEQGDMPPTGSLSQEQIDLIAQWIDEGALEFPANECEDEVDSYIRDDDIIEKVMISGHTDEIFNGS